jgi:hypothetical protein
MTETVHNAKDEEYASTLVEWFCQERLASITVDEPKIKEKATYFSTHLHIKNCLCFKGKLYRFKARKVIHKKSPATAKFRNQPVTHQFHALPASSK